MPSKYNQVISEFVKQTDLKRIRIKTDPKISSNFAHANDYEGFVLEEDGLGNVVVYIPELEDELEVPYGNYSLCDTEDPYENPQFENLKKHIIINLIENDMIEEEDPEIENIMTFNCIYQLHNHLNQKGMEDDEFLDMLKSYFK